LQGGIKLTFCRCQLSAWIAKRGTYRSDILETWW
jgi:hypothetical protein